MPRRHNESGTRLYSIWKNMRRRCSNPHCAYYHSYGGRGISVCAEWHKYENFRDWALTHGYKDGLTIDRIDNDRNYAPDNCRRFPAFADGCAKLTKAGFDRNKIFCYVLSYGKNKRQDEERAINVFDAGAMPFMQLYRDFTETKTEYSKDWEEFARTWQRPAIIKAMMKFREECKARDHL